MKYCKHNIKLLPSVPEPKYVVFTDFDETYLAHQNREDYKNDLKELVYNKR